ncbi:MAG: Fe-S cluster assembly protein SufD [Tunicatimonas sp.]
MSLQETFAQQFAAYEQRLNGARDEETHQQRRAAMEVLERDGLPGKRDEEYKYTPITRALEKQFGEAAAEAAPAGNLADQFAAWRVDEQANILVFVNGQYSDELSVVVSPPEELIIKPLSEAFQQHPALMNRYFARQTATTTDAFAALNTALVQQGSLIHVPAGQVVTHPTYFYYLSDTSSAAAFSQTRNLFVLEARSQATFTEMYFHTGEHPAYHNAATELWLHERAVAYYHKVQSESPQAYHTGHTHVYQSADSLFQAVTVTLDGAIVRNNLNVTLDAEGCETHMYGLYMMRGKTHVDNHTSVDHRQPNSFSNELYKGIMDDASHGVFNGKIYVQQIAQKTNAFQSNRNILLTDNASVDTKPQLEIWADDVKCSHGATTGQMDAEQLFYLRARGLDKVQARALLLQAFAGEVVQNVKSDALRDYLRSVIDQRLLKETTS